MSGGFYATNKQFSGEIPIKQIDFNNKRKRVHDKIVASVTNIIELKKKFNASKLTTDQEIISRQIDAIEMQINSLIYELYGINAKEQKLIEDSLK